MSAVLPFPAHRAARLAAIALALTASLAVAAATPRPKPRPIPLPPGAEQPLPKPEPPRSGPQVPGEPLRPAKVCIRLWRWTLCFDRGGRR